MVKIKNKDSCIFIKRNSKVAFRLFAEETIIYSGANNKLHFLNEIGTKIWKFSSSWIPQDKIVLFICKEYNVNEKKAKLDLFPFIKKMGKAKLLFIKQK
jgi:hypothetical protein